MSIDFIDGNGGTSEIVSWKIENNCLILTYPRDYTTIIGGTPIKGPVFYPLSNILRFAPSNDVKTAYVS